MAKRSGHAGYFFGIVLGVMGFATIVADAHATEAPDPEALIREGVVLRRGGEDAAALKRFEEAYALGKTPRAIAQVGLAEQALGRWAAANKHLRQAVQFTDDDWIQKNRSSLNGAIAVVGTHVGRIEVTGTPSGAEVRVDGELAGRLPLPGPLTTATGGVAIEVRAPGYLSVVRTATISAGSLSRETFTLQPTAPSAESSARPETTQIPNANGIDGTGPNSPMPRQREAGPSIHRTLALISIGVSATAFGFAALEHLSWQRKVGSFRSMSACGIDFANKGAPGCATLYDEGGQAKTLALLGYGAGTAFLATGLILYFTESSGPDPIAPKFACAPSLSHHGFQCAFRY